MGKTVADAKALIKESVKEFKELSGTAQVVRVSGTVQFGNADQGYTRGISVNTFANKKQEGGYFGISNVGSKLMELGLGGSNVREDGSLYLGAFKGEKGEKGGEVRPAILVSVRQSKDREGYIVKPYLAYEIKQLSQDSIDNAKHIVVKEELTVANFDALTRDGIDIDALGKKAKVIYLSDEMLSNIRVNIDSLGVYFKGAEKPVNVITRAFGEDASGKNVPVIGDALFAIVRASKGGEFKMDKGVFKVYTKEDEIVTFEVGENARDIEEFKAYIKTKKGQKEEMSAVGEDDFSQEAIEAFDPQGYERQEEPEPEPTRARGIEF